MPLYHTDNGDPVYKMPADGTCSFCGDWIAEDCVEHDETIAVCVGCNRQYRMAEANEHLTRITDEDMGVDQ